MKLIKKITTALFIAIAIFQPIIAFAGGRLPGNLLIGDDRGIEVRKDGTYFINIPELRPSEVYYKTLTINNLEKYAYSLSLVTLPETLSASGPQNLLDEVSMEMYVDKKLVYIGALNGKGNVDMVFDGIKLGSINPGDVKELEIKLESSPCINLYTDQYSEASIGWEFIAVADTDPTIPKTGVIQQYSDWIIAGGMGLIFILVIIRKKTIEKYAQL